LLTNADAAAPPRHPRCYADTVFVFFSNRLGCLGSIAVSIVGTALLILLMRSCS
jgi:hypothetical protein